MIHVNFDNMKGEIDKSVGQDPGNNGDGNGSSNTRRLKLIGFFVNNRIGHFEQFITTMEMIQVDVDDTKANDTVSTTFRWKMKYNLREKERKAKKK